MRQIRPDLWETEPFSPFQGLTTHAYLWTPPGGGNVLLYAPGDVADLDEIDRLGGISRHYLSHQDEAGPMLATIAERFGSQLHAPAAEADRIGRFAAPDVLLDRRHVDDAGIEVIPTPGHSPGSTCYLVPGHDGAAYLFTGDTLYRGADGRWRAGYIGGMSDADGLASALDLLATLQPDLVASSAFAGDAGVHRVPPGAWPSWVDEARAALAG